MLANLNLSICYIHHTIKKRLFVKCVPSYDINSTFDKEPKKKRTAIQNLTESRYKLSTSVRLYNDTPMLEKFQCNNSNMKLIMKVFFCYTMAENPVYPYLVSQYDWHKNECYYSHQRQCIVRGSCIGNSQAPLRI